MVGFSFCVLLSCPNVLYKFDADSELLCESLFVHPVLSELGFLGKLHQSSIDSVKVNIEERQVLMQELYHIFNLINMTYLNLFKTESGHISNDVAFLVLKLLEKGLKILKKMLGNIFVCACLKKYLCNFPLS